MRRGSVPTDRFGPILDELVRDRWPHDGGYSVLAEKIGCDESAIETIVNQEHEGVTFDFTDRILCALGRVDIWQGRLGDLYESVELIDERTCKHGVSVSLDERLVDNCSRCRIKGDRNNERKRRDTVFAKETHCRNGHVRTPENTITTAKGGKRCRVCKRATQHSGRVKAPA